MLTKNLKLNTDPRFDLKFKNYPDEIRPKLLGLRNLIIESANEIDSIDELEETIKWGEPSFLVKKGSTIRIDWKAKNPEMYAIFFKCTSKIVPTIKELFEDTFNYENNRALWFQMDEVLPKKELKVCIKLALLYHSVKDDPKQILSKI